MFLFFFCHNFYKNKATFKIFSPQKLEVYRIVLMETPLESVMFYYPFSVINTTFVPCTALLYDSTAASRTLKLSTTLLSISCGIRLISLLMISSLVCGLFLQTLFSQTLFSVPWEMRRVSCSRNEVAPHFSNRILEYLRHNFPWDRLISHQTDNLWPSYSQDLNPPDYFLRGYLKNRTCENNHRQERTSSE